MQNYESLFDFAESLSGPPSGGRVQMWTVGAFLAAAFFIYGLVCCLTGEARMPNLPLRGYPPLSQGLTIEVPPALAVPQGLFLISVALFIHFHWFWGHFERLLLYHELGKLLAILGVVASLLRYGYVWIVYT